MPGGNRRSPHGQWIDELAATKRFGSNDRKGTANLIDDAARQRAASAIETGRCASLARRIVLTDDRSAGEGVCTVDVAHTVGRTLCIGADIAHLSPHGERRTHLDALNHFGRHGTWYGGRAVDDPDGPDLADLAGHTLFTRGVVADIPAVRGADWVDASHPVTGDDIDAALERVGVVFEPGDALLLYMGRDRWEAAGNELDLRGHTPMPGAGADAARWIVEHDVSIVCWDFLDGVCDGEPEYPVHLLSWAIGLLLVDNCDLTAAVTTARHSDRATGGLVVAPPALPRATGFLVDPLFIQ